MKQKSFKWLTPLLMFVIVVGGVYYSLKKSAPVMKRAEIDVINPAYTKPWQAGNGILLRVFPKIKETVKVNQEKTFLLVASLPSKTSVPSNFKVTGLEGELTYNPSLIKITSIKGWNLPIVLKKPTTKVINKSVARIDFAYGASPNVSNQKPHPILKGFVGSNINEAVLEVKYKVVKAGPSTAIAFPKNKLKLTTNLSSKNEFQGKSDLVLWVKGLSDVVKPPVPTPTPQSKISIFDLNKDGKVNILDYNLFLREFGKTGANRADFNHDRLVDIVDYNMLLQHFKSDTVHHPRFDGGPVNIKVRN